MYLITTNHAAILGLFRILNCQIGNPRRCLAQLWIMRRFFGPSYTNRRYALAAR